MKFTSILLLLGATQAISLNEMPVLMHNTSADDQYLTKVFHKYAVLGVDPQGEANGRRVLTKSMALFVARDVVGPVIIPPNAGNIAESGFSSATFFAAEQIFFK